MIFYPRFSKTAGNLGNQFFQLASMTGMAKRYKCEFMVPEWKYSHYFVNPPKQFIVEPRPQMMLSEPTYNYCPEWWDVHTDDFKTKNVSIFGWLQSPHYWKDAIDEVKELFTFKPEFIEEVKAKAPSKLFDKPVIAISVRRGDYVNNPNYELLTAKYYIMALYDSFPDFHEKYNLMFFSDDIPYCKVHFQCLSNAFFAEGMDPMTQLCLGSMCDHAVIANSTFSFWIAYLQELNGKNPTVVRPIDIFQGEMKKNNDITDHYPANWKLFNPNFVRMNLLDVTFTIPVSFDSNERRENLDLAVMYLMADFDTNIIIGEQGNHKRFEGYAKYPRTKYHYFDGMAEFHRTRMLNEMANMCETHIVANWDADVLVPPMQIIEAVRMIKEQRKDMVYPYDGRFARVQPREKWVPLLRKFVDAGMFGSSEFLGMGKNGVFNGPHSVGGAVMYATDKFIEGGMENEKMISYAPEDSERFHRFNRLGYAVARVDGVLYHIDHPLTTNSSVNHIHYHGNVMEYKKILGLEIDELRTYVRTWPWVNQYKPSYYESIHGEAVKSRDVVFGLLKEWGAIDDMDVIIDVGCATGSWGSDVPNFYFGIDFGVPQDKLVISKDSYIDWDLKQPITNKEIEAWFGDNFKAGLVLNIETSEHLEEQYAEQLIDSLSLLGDTILFSGALPGQGGIAHYNEQMQSYWVDKFKRRGYFLYKDDIRKSLFHNPNVAVWIKQNLMLFTKIEYEIDYEPNFIHPQMYLNIVKTYGITR